MNIGSIKKCFKNDKVFYSRHARHEMLAEECGRIYDEEVFEAVIAGEIIEAYPEDFPYPSVLLFGRTKRNRPIHIVCAYSSADDTAVIITAYEPNP